MIELHCVPTGNNLKVVILLEETGQPYELIRYRMFEGEHLTPGFRRLNPNNRFPTIRDTAPADGGAPLPIFESAAILIYLAEKAGALLPTDLRSRSECLQWLVWQAAGQGPMHGQAHHFVRYAPEGQDYARARYLREAERLLNVMEYRLERSPWLGGADYSIADIACFPWLNGLGLIGLGLEDLPHLAAWHRRIAARPAVIRAVAALQDADRATYTQTRAVLTEQQWSNMFGDRLHAAARLR